MNSATFSSSLARLQALPWATYGTRTVAGLRACCLAAQLLAMVGAIAAAIVWEHRQRVRDAAIAAIAAVVVAAQATHFAGRSARRLWARLLDLSERMGRAYARLLVGAPVAVVAVAIAPAPVAAPVAAPAVVDLAAMTCRELRELIGTRRHLSKARLIELAAAAMA